MPNLQEFKDNMAKDLYGMTVSEAISKGICIQCKQEALPRCHSEADKQEFKISGLCKICFDEITGGG